MNKFTINSDLKDGIYTITSITVSSEVLLKRLAHMLGGLIDADLISVKSEDDDSVLVETLEPDDEDYYTPNPWLEDNADRWY